MASCSDAFAGTGAEGAPCLGSQECIGGLTCVGYTDVTEGACKMPPAQGESCGRHRDADAAVTLNLAIDFGSHPDCAPGNRCSDEKCVSAKSEGDTCTSRSDCAVSLDCHAGHCTTSAIREAEGGPCHDTRDCSGGFYCDRPSGQVANGACQKKKPATSPCHGSFGAFTSDCLGRCDAPSISSTGTCVSFCGSP